MVEEHTLAADVDGVASAVVWVREEEQVRNRQSLRNLLRSQKG